MRRRVHRRGRHGSSRRLGAGTFRAGQAMSRGHDKSCTPGPSRCHLARGADGKSGSPWQACRAVLRPPPHGSSSTRLSLASRNAVDDSQCSADVRRARWPTLAGDSSCTLTAWRRHRCAARDSRYTSDARRSPRVPPPRGKSSKLRCPRLDCGVARYDSPHMPCARRALP